MTEDVLVQLEKRLTGGVGPWYCVGLTPEDVPALIAEVRRLRGLIQAGELGTESMCPWCRLTVPCEGHDPTCPAFPPEP